MMQTEANTTNTINNINTDVLLTSGGCARLLVAARLPLLLSSSEEEQPSLSFEELNAALRQRPLLAAADRLFPALVAAAEACHGALTPPAKCAGAPDLPKTRPQPPLRSGCGYTEGSPSGRPQCPARTGLARSRREQ